MYFTLLCFILMLWNLTMTFLKQLIKQVYSIKGFRYNSAKKQMMFQNKSSDPVIELFLNLHW